MNNENTDTASNKASHLSGNDEQDRVYAALTHLESVLQADGGTYWQEDQTSQKALIAEKLEALYSLGVLPIAV